MAERSHSLAVTQLSLPRGMYETPLVAALLSGGVVGLDWFGSQ